VIEIVVVEPQSTFRIARQMPAFFRGTLAEGPGILMRRAATLEVSGGEPVAFHVDGEPRQGGRRVAMATRPGVLNVKVSA
jgi:diacylglycerol kinase family enzyme